MSTELHIELDRIVAARDRDNMGPTIADPEFVKVNEASVSLGG
ncbi:hypothetical protein [Cryobacterium cryoconiti]|nr:hypothetical protein [Cryobacterium cryoconiti]